MRFHPSKSNGKKTLLLTVTASLVLLICFFAIQNSDRNFASARMAPSPTENYPPVQFLSDIKTGLEEAARTGSPAMIFFMETDCPYSRAMLDEVFSDPEIRRLSRGFLCIQVDMNGKDSVAVCQEYNVVGSPTVQFVSATGIPLQQLTQKRSAAELKKQMETILYSVAWRIPPRGISIK